jgi:hypothetical protein
MLKEHNKCSLPDQSNNHNNLDVEIFPDKEEVKLSMGGKEGWISIKDLYALAFIIVGKDEQDSLMPIKQVEVTKYRKQLSVKAKKDMKKGEFLTFNYEFDVPTAIEQNLRGIVEKRNSSGLIIPR